MCIETNFISTKYSGRDRQPRQLKLIDTSAEAPWLNILFRSEDLIVEIDSVMIGKLRKSAIKTKKVEFYCMAKYVKSRINYQSTFKF